MHTIHQNQIRFLCQIALPSQQTNHSLVQRYKNENNYIIFYNILNNCKEHKFNIG
uniref:Uncharacterized protein n=1 Tax=Anguilla anguilla TaxID=7936 RepID=A0A0E9TJ18_ANGAN